MAGETIRFEFIFFVSNGIISAFHDYNNYVNKICDCEFEFVLTTGEHVTSGARGKVDLTEVLSAEAYQADYAYVLEKEALLNSRGGLRELKNMGVEIGKLVSQGNLRSETQYSIGLEQRIE